ncbi:MAG: hypothetical protein HW390_3145, partial [Candidatus Brocadiaceae bacterium]|nr:hypothetical protein [Candidatus Brocadiaceae bacterium]
MDYKKERHRIREMERIFHFCGHSFFDEVSPLERSLLVEKYFSWISGNPEVLEAFESYRPTNVTLTWTFESRISGLAVVIANYIAGSSLFDRNFRYPDLGEIILIPNRIPSANSYPEKWFPCCLI